VRAVLLRRLGRQHLHPGMTRAWMGLTGVIDLGARTEGSTGTREISRSPSHNRSLGCPIQSKPGRMYARPVHAERTPDRTSVPMRECNECIGTDREKSECCVVPTTRGNRSHETPSRKGGASIGKRSSAPRSGPEPANRVHASRSRSNIRHRGFLRRCQTGVRRRRLPSLLSEPRC
jgi:hypothetical protein